MLNSIDTKSEWKHSFIIKIKIEKENANDETDIIFSHYASDNHGIALLGCAKR